MLKIAKVLGKRALQANFVPKGFSRAAALTAMHTIGESVTSNCDPIERLKGNGILIEKEGGPHTQLRFALDPIAEFLAAAAYNEDCSTDQEEWTRLLEQSKHSAGFQVALKLVRQAYSAHGDH